jgi:hypothetical protein
MAQTLWEEMSSDMPKYFPRVSADFKKQFKKLGKSRQPAELLESVQKLITYIQKV